MKDELIERIAAELLSLGWFPTQHRESALSVAERIRAIARPAILEEAAQAIQCGCCDVCGEDPDYEYVCANKLAARIRSLAHTTGQEGCEK